MDRRFQTRIDKIVGMATDQHCLTGNTFESDIISQELCEAEKELYKTNNNNNEDRCRNDVPGGTEGALQEESAIECAVSTTHEDRNLDISTPTENNTEHVLDNNEELNENANNKLIDHLRVSGSSDDGDFGSSSSDEYICNSDESSSSSSSDDEPTPAKRSKTSVNITIPQTPLPQNVLEDSISGIPSSPQDVFEDHTPECSFWERNGMSGSGKKRKPRNSNKERRQERVKRHLFRNKGLEYTTKSGKTKQNREMRDLENCRRKCKERLPQDLRKTIFEKYWSLGSYERRSIYISKCIEVCKKRTSKTSPKKKRNVSFLYFVQAEHTRHPICKGCFLKTFDESHKFLQTICEKLRKNGGHLPPRTSRAGKSIPDFKLEEIKSHIACFPTIESHYGRNKTTKKFLNSELNLQVIYNLYKLKTASPVSKTIFKKMFNSMNLSFKKPSLDTCSKCDRIAMKKKYASEEEVTNLEKELKEHQESVKVAYEEKRADKLLAQTRDDIMVIAFDLQQCLPTPYLKTNVAFYKRQLWTYNLTIHDLNTNKAFCYMWPECDGNRGANDIASCLYNFIVKQLPNLNANAKKLIMYSDSCPGQNKNSIVSTMLMLAAKESHQLQTIEHKFLIPGHTHMEVDSDHALIERKKKHTTMEIHLPRDWYQLVRTASTKTAKFNVIEMSRDMFYDFALFSKQGLTIKKNSTDGTKFLWSDIRSTLYAKDSFPCFSSKKEFKDEESMTMDCSKRGKHYDMVAIDMVSKAYNSKINISTEKKKDLLALLCFIHEDSHEFFRSLSCKSDVKDTAPDNDDGSEED